MDINIKNKQTYKNLSVNIIAYIIQFIISFYISPIIVKNVGTSAYGFIGLANDFVSYAGIITSIFNAAAARFIANAVYKKEIDKANGYFNSLIVINVILSGIFGILGMVLVPNLDKLFTIQPELVFDVKLTFSIIFISYIVTLITLVFSTATYVSNRTDMQGIRSIISYIVRFAMIIVFLNFVSIRIYWVALASLISILVVAVLNIGLKRKLTPELSINLKCSKKTYAVDLASAGGWMALTSISTLLLRGLDLTIANLILGDYEMGLLSVARTFPNSITGIIATLAPIFSPAFIVFYSRNDIEGLVSSINKSINTLASIMFVPITGFIVFSYDFYRLWQKSLSQKELMIVTAIAIITILEAYFNTVTASLAQISVVTNKLWRAGVMSLVCGIISIIVEIILIKYTSFGIYAIPISTTVVMTLRYILFNPIYAAWCLKKPKTCFFTVTLKAWVSIPVLLILMFIIRYVLPVNSWISLCQDAVIAGVLGYIIMVIVYEKDELKKIKNIK